MSEWQPIETAPKDGTRILVAHARLQSGGVAYWEDLGEGMAGWIARGMWEPFGELGLAHPTHWMPMPSLPEPTQ